MKNRCYSTKSTIIPNGQDLPGDVKKRLHESLTDGIRKNEEVFENKITYIGGGAIALTLAFASGRSGFHCAWLFWVAIGTFSISLLVNLFSALRAIHAASKIKQNDVTLEKTHDLNKRGRWMGWFSFFALAIGILALSIFIFSNTNQKTENMNEEKTTATDHGSGSGNENRSISFEIPYLESTQSEESTQSASEEDRD